MSDIILFFPKLTKDNTESRLLPASVLMVAAPLVKEGYSVKIIDQRVDSNWRETLINELKSKPLVVGFSALTGKQILYALEASKIVKNNSSTLTVWGGVHVSLLPKQTLKNQYIDLAVIGEGEGTFLNLVEKIAKRQSYEGLAGLGYKKENKVFFKPLTEFLDLDDLPHMPYHLVDIEDYVSEVSFASGKKARNLVFYTSRGCPYRCGFCYNKQFNKRRWRGMSANRVFEEMKRLIDNYRINAFEIEDDEFFINTERVKEICKLILKEGIKIEIFTNCRVNLIADNVDSDYLKLLFKAGFRTLGFGIESGSTKILDLIHKDIEISQIFRTIKKLTKAGINSKYYFMAGFPTETIKDIQSTTDLIIKMKQMNSKIRIPAWRIFTPYPGTDLYRLSIQKGWNPPKTLEEWAGYDFNTVRMPWIKNRKKMIIENSRFLIKYLKLSSKKKASIYFKLGRLYGKLVDFRWSNHLFSFVPEKYFIFLVLWLKKISKR